LTALGRDIIVMNFNEIDYAKTLAIGFISGITILGLYILKKNILTKLVLTHDDLLKETDIKYTTLTKVESVVVNKPSIKTMAKIAKALGVSKEELIK
jgi:hypothetical protein